MPDKRIIVPCSMCGTPINLNERSLKRYMKVHTTNKYVCLACTNGNLTITQTQRAKRSENAKKLWQNPDYAKKVSSSIIKTNEEKKS